MHCFEYSQHIFGNKLPKSILMKANAMDLILSFFVFFVCLPQICWVLIKCSLCLCFMDWIFGFQCVFYIVCITVCCIIVQWKSFFWSLSTETWLRIIALQLFEKAFISHPFEVVG